MLRAITAYIMHLRRRQRCASILALVEPSHARLPQLDGYWQKQSSMARRYTEGVRGPNMITAMPARHRAAPSMSQRLGRMPSTSHSQNSAVPM